MKKEEKMVGGNVMGKLYASFKFRLSFEAKSSGNSSSEDQSNLHPKTL